MAGIYIHIPFCHKKCYYCDFYSVIGIRDKQALIQALLKEIEIQKNYLDQKVIQTIYFGGGTPSVLSSYELHQILNQIRNFMPISDDAEISIEVNPDDLNIYYLDEIESIGINRLSIGIQSFNDEILKYLNRRHNADQTANAVFLTKNAGIKNISIDLIYGISGMDINEWKKNIEKAIELNVDHISAYHLSLEPNTVFGKMKKQGKLKEIDEEKSWSQFNILVDLLKAAGYEHYEISNFARNKKYSRHNTSYWHQKEYLGLGPSAHSYNLISRQWNISDVNIYISSINKNKVPFTLEMLSTNDMYNEYIITGLRTKWGININYIQQQFGYDYHEHSVKLIEKISPDLFIYNPPFFSLTRKGLFQSDNIISDFLIDIV